MNKTEKTKDILQIKHPIIIVIEISFEIKKIKKKP